MISGSKEGNVPYCLAGGFLSNIPKLKWKTRNRQIERVKKSFRVTT
jgi:hypothetical protein